MKVLTAEQMAHADHMTIAGGVPSIELMRNAGAVVHDVITGTLDIEPDTRIVIVAGKGNNGGDGFRVAELLAGDEHEVTVLLIGKQSAVNGDARTCMNAAITAGVQITEISAETSKEELSDNIQNAEIIVDAMFGTGLKGDISGFHADVIDMINDSSATILSVDIPSGVNATTGEMAEHTIEADYTITFECLKAGHILPPGKIACGEVHVAGIGLSADVLDTLDPYAETLTSAEATNLIPVRRWDAHKGTAGRVFVLAGSVGKTGAAALTSMAALRVGAGLVTLGCPESLNDIMEVKLTEAMTLPLAEVRKKRCLSLRALGAIRNQAKIADVMAIGPGLGTNAETSELVRRFLTEYTGRAVIDADGLNAFVGNIELFRDMPCELVLTPHPGELSRLLGVSADDISRDPASAVKRAAELTGKTVLLKGSPTVIMGPDRVLHVNSTGNEALATGGTGDVLTGIIAGLAAQGLDMLNAAVLGAYLHGLSGEMAGAERGVHAMIAGDVIEKIASTIVITLSGTEPESFI